MYEELAKLKEASSKPIPDEDDPPSDKDVGRDSSRDKKAKPKTNRNLSLVLTTPTLCLTTIR